VSVSGKQWFCNGQQIREITRRPTRAELYKTFSVYYIGGVGFSILKGDARQPPDHDVWHPLQFAFYNDEDYSSFVTNAGQSHTLRLQPQDRRWAHLILPTTNHTHVQASSPDYGGIIGELPIFLALMAFTTSREYLPAVLPHTFINGTWEPTHQWRMESRSNPLRARLILTLLRRTPPRRCGQGVHLPSKLPSEPATWLDRILRQRPLRLRDGRLRQILLLGSTRRRRYSLSRQAAGRFPLPSITFPESTVQYIAHYPANTLLRFPPHRLAACSRLFHDLFAQTLGRRTRLYERLPCGLRHYISSFIRYDSSLSAGGICVHTSLISRPFPYPDCNLRLRFAVKAE